MSNNLGSYPNDIASHPTRMNCVYAISGAYGLLPRILYYLTLVFAIFGRRKEWLVIGAFVSALTYAGTTAIHQMALTDSKDPIYDLDIMGAWAVLSTGALAYISMMHWSSTLQDSKARFVLMGWGLLVGIALIFGRTELFDQALADPEPACYSSSGRLLKYPVELISSEFDCTYTCFSARKPMRQKSEVMAVPRSVLSNKYTGFTKVLVGPIQFAAYAALSFDTMGHTPSQHCMNIVFKQLNPKWDEDMVKSIYNASMETPYGGYFLLWHYFHKANWTWRKFVIYFIALPWFMLGLLIDIFALPLMIINIVLNELTIMSPELPTNEADFAIGQWGPWVSSLLVIVAAVVNKVLELQERSKAVRREMREEERAATAVAGSSASFELGSVDIEDGQTVGVVKPRLVHVPTLQDMGVSHERPKC